MLDVDDGERDAKGFGKCRMQPEDKDGFEDADGCLDTDNDRDGVADLADGARGASGFGARRDQREDEDCELPAHAPMITTRESPEIPVQTALRKRPRRPLSLPSRCRAPGGGRRT